MKKNISTTARFTVLNNAEEVLTTKSQETAMKKVDEMMASKSPKIFLRDNQEKKTSSWTKESHQQNYRLQSVAYVAPVKVEQSVESE